MKKQKWTYIRLTDADYLDRVMRLGGIGNQWLWKDGEWLLTSLYLRYSMPESDQYEMYEEITEKKAYEIIGSKK